MPRFYRSLEFLRRLKPTYVSFFSTTFNEGLYEERADQYEGILLGGKRYFLVLFPLAVCGPEGFASFLLFLSCLVV